MIILGDRRIVFGTIRMLFSPPQIRAIGRRKSRAFESEKVSGYIIDESAYNLPGSRSSPKCPFILDPPGTSVHVYCSLQQHLLFIQNNSPFPIGLNL